MKTKNGQPPKKRTSPRGKKKDEDGGHAPLRGRVLFLDLKNYRGAAKLEQQLKLLGGVVEKCFSKDIHILVTNRGTPKDYERRHDGASTSAGSPGISTPSPFNLGWTRSVESPQADSPSQGVASRPLSRGRSLLQQANVTQNYGSTNIIECARQWKIRITHVTKVQGWVQKELNKLPAELKEPAKVSKKAKQTKVKRLKGNFIKFESDTKQYRPVEQEFPSQPVVMFDTPPGTCPFERKKDHHHHRGNEVAEQRAEPEAHGQHEIHKETKPTNKMAAHKKDNKDKTSGSGSFYDGRLVTAGQLRRFINHKIRKEQKKGYCEVCQVKYSDIHKHVKCDTHQKFVKNHKNYISLDEMISQGPNLQQFLDDVVKFHQLHQQEGIKEMEDFTKVERNAKRAPKQPKKDHKTKVKGQKLGVKPPGKIEDLLCNETLPPCYDEVADQNPGGSRIRDTCAKTNMLANLLSQDVGSVSKFIKVDVVAHGTGGAPCEPSNVIPVAGVGNSDFVSKQEPSPGVADFVVPAAVAKVTGSSGAVLQGQDCSSVLHSDVTLGIILPKPDVNIDVSQCDAVKQPDVDVVDESQPTIDSHLATADEAEKNDDCQYRSSLEDASSEEEETSEKGKSKPNRKRKRRKRVKLKEQWSILSDRSMQKLLQSSEGDQEDFTGFMKPSAKMSQDPPTDMSFVNVNEVEIGSDSNQEWILDDPDDKDTGSNYSDAGKLNRAKRAHRKGAERAKAELCEQVKTKIRKMRENVDSEPQLKLFSSEEIPSQSSAVFGGILQTLRQVKQPATEGSASAGNYPPEGSQSLKSGQSPDVGHESLNMSIEEGVKTRNQSPRANNPMTSTPKQNKKVKTTPVKLESSEISENRDDVLCLDELTTPTRRSARIATMVDQNTISPQGRGVLKESNQRVLASPSNKNVYKSKEESVQRLYAKSPSPKGKKRSKAAAQLFKEDGKEDEIIAKVSAQVNHDKMSTGSAWSMNSSKSLQKVDTDIVFNFNSPSKIKHSSEVTKSAKPNRTSHKPTSCFLSLDNVKGRKMIDMSDVSSTASSVTSHKLLKGEKKNHVYKFSYIPGCQTQQKKIEKERRSRKLTQTPTDTQIIDKNLDRHEMKPTYKKLKMNPPASLSPHSPARTSKKHTTHSDSNDLFVNLKRHRSTGDQESKAVRKSPRKNSTKVVVKQNQNLRRSPRKQKGHHTDEASYEFASEAF